jgi:hypothetical protein
MDLTKQQKLEAYTYAMVCILENLTIANDSNVDSHERINGYDLRLGICLMLRDWMDQDLSIVDEWISMSLTFPEFFESEPAFHGSYWWDHNKAGQTQRLKAMENAIQLTEKLPS